MNDIHNEVIIDFPCDFPIKAMGLASDSFEITVIDIVRRHAPDLKETAIHTRPSSNGKYVSVTVTIRAEHRAQLDAIYQDLTDCPDVLMAL